MKLTAERLPESQIRLEIISDEAEFATALDKASKRVAQRVTVPGFRRGKAPRTLVERHVGRAMIVDEANGALMDDLYRQALEQEDLAPVARPSVEVLTEEPLSFRVEVEISPTADVTGYENVRVESEHISVTDQDVDDYIERLREDQSPWVDPTTPRPVQEGDEVVVDIAAFEGDEPFDEPTTGATFVLGRDNLLPQIRDMIVGATVGEPVETIVTFPEANGEEDERPIPETLLGKILTYRITVQSAKERELLPLDDELAASLGGRAMTLAELRAEIRSNLRQQAEMQARNTLVANIMEKLRDEVAKVEVGPALIDQQTREDAMQQLQQIGGMGIDINEIFGKNTGAVDNFLERIKPESERRLRNTLILREIAKNENLDVTTEEVHEEVHRLGMEHSVLDDERTVELITEDLRERKLLERVVEIATEGKGVIDDSPESAYTLPPSDEADAESNESIPANEGATEEPQATADAAAVGADDTEISPDDDATVVGNAGTMDEDGTLTATDAPANAGETPKPA
ncbi:MAG: trigger factor [Chloroflexota bacterium]|nr:trigger factor [Chloroflexota bacterium]